MIAHAPAQPCCLPNEILTNQTGLGWTIETTHHINCPGARPMNHEAPNYFTVIGTDRAPQLATDAHYEYAGHLAAATAATSNDVEATKATIWAGVEALAERGVGERDIIGVLAAALAIFTIEAFNPAVDTMEELTPGFNYREAIGRATAPDAGAAADPMHQTEGR